MSNEDFEIRVVKAADWENFRAIRTRMIEQAPLAFGGNVDAERFRDNSDWRAWARESEEGVRRRFWVATSQGTWIASIFCDLEEGSGLVYGMWTEEPWRGKGVASALLEELETWAVDREAARLHLKVNVINRSAIGLYEKVGFKDSGERSPMRNNPSQVMMAMVKPLCCRPHSASLGCT